MRFYQIKSGARFYWPGRTSSYCLKCTWLVAYHLQAQRFAVMAPWAAVNDVAEEHEDEIPAAERVRSAHQQAMGILFIIGLILAAIIWFLVMSAS